MGSTYIKTLLGCSQETCPDGGFLSPTYDLNQDGYGDLVTAECHREGTQEICTSYQVRLGLKNGGYVDLFKHQTKPDPIKVGDTVYHSAKFYADNPLVRTGVAEPIPYPVRLLGPEKPKYFTGEELKDLCAERFKQANQSSERSECIGAAEKDPKDHSFQPQSHPEALVYFDPPKKPEGAAKIKDLPNPAGPASPDHLVERDAVHLELFARSITYPFLDFGMELAANVIARVQDRSSRELGDYLFALESNAITPEELVDTISHNWAEFGPLLVASTETLDGQRQEIVNKIKIIIVEVAEKSPNVVDDFFSLMCRMGLPHYRTYEALSLLYDIDPERATPLLKRVLVSPATDSHLKETCRALLAEEEEALLPTDSLIQMIESVINRAPEFATAFRNLDQHDRATARLRADYDRLISLLTKRKLTPAQAVAVLDLIHRNRVLDEAGLKPLTTHLDKTFQADGFLIPLVDYLLEQTERPDWCDIQWQSRLRFLLPNLNAVISGTTNPEKIPSIDKLLTLSDRIVATRGSVLFATARKLPSLRQPLTANTSKELKALFREMTRSLGPKSLVSVASTARNILGDDEALPFLVGLSQRGKGMPDEQSAQVRLAAYQALAPFLSYEQTTPSPKLATERFHKGLDDDSAAVRVYTAQALIGVGDRYVAERLSSQLVAYVQDPSYLTTRRKKPDLFDSTEILHKQRYKMETAISITPPDGGKPVVTTLKSLALQAIFQFGLFGENEKALHTLIAHEEIDYVVFGLLPLVRTRLAALKRGRREVPETINQMAIAIFARGVKEVDTLPADKKAEATKILTDNVQPIYMMLASPDLETRKQALSALCEADSLGTLANLLRDSLNKDAFIRQAASWALETYKAMFGPDTYAEGLKVISTSSPSEEVPEVAIREAKRRLAPTPTR